MVTPGPGSLTMYRKPVTVRSNSSVPGTRLWTCTKWARTTIDSPVVVLVHTSRGAETNSVKRVTFPSGSRNTVNRSETVPATCASNVPQSTVNSKLSFDAWTKWSGGLAEALPAARTEQADTASTAVSRRDFMGGPFLGGNSHATRSTALPRSLLPTSASCRRNEHPTEVASDCGEGLGGRDPRGQNEIRQATRARARAADGCRGAMTAGNSTSPGSKRVRLAGGQSA